MSREAKTILGGLTSAQVARLSPEVRRARAAYIADSYAELDGLFAGGATELRSDHPDKDDWAKTRRQTNEVESLNQLLDVGYQVGEDGAIYEPESEFHLRGKRRVRDD